MGGETAFPGIKPCFFRSDGSGPAGRRSSNTVEVLAAGDANSGEHPRALFLSGQDGLANRPGAFLSSSFENILVKSSRGMPKPLSITYIFISFSTF